MNKHRSTCETLTEFKKFLREWTDPDEEKKSKNIWDLSDDFDLDQMIPLDSNCGTEWKVEDIVLCCCKPEAPHDEQKKFVMK